MTILPNLVFAIGIILTTLCLTILSILMPVTGALLHDLSSIPFIAIFTRLISVQ